MTGWEAGSEESANPYLLRACIPPPMYLPCISQVAPPGLRGGQLVAIEGLVSRTDLNGCLGTCVSFDPTNGRVTVDVEGGVGHVALKPANLRVLD